MNPYQTPRSDKPDYQDSLLAESFPNLNPYQPPMNLPEKNELAQEEIATERPDKAIKEFLSERGRLEFLTDFLSCQRDALARSEIEHRVNMHERTEREQHILGRIYNLFSKDLLSDYDVTPPTLTRGVFVSSFDLERLFQVYPQGRSILKELGRRSWIGVISGGKYDRDKYFICNTQLIAGIDLLNDELKETNEKSLGKKTVSPPVKNHEILELFKNKGTFTVLRELLELQRASLEILKTEYHYHNFIRSPRNRSVWGRMLNFFNKNLENDHDVIDPILTQHAYVDGVALKDLFLSRPQAESVVNRLIERGWIERIRPGRFVEGVTITNPELVQYIDFFEASLAERNQKTGKKRT